MHLLFFTAATLAALATWKGEIESLGTRVVVAQVYTENAGTELRLPAETPDRPAVAALLSNPGVVEQFIRAHALTVHSPDRSIVLLNMARETEFDTHKEELVAHEMGHIWLQAKGFRAPPAPIPNCALIHITDMVQHVLIREELNRRGIPHRPWLVASVEQAMPHIRQGQGDTCQELQKLALWVDVDLALTEKDWPRRPEFLAAMKEAYPRLDSMETDLVGILKSSDLGSPLAYQRAMRRVVVRLQLLER